MRIRPALALFAVGAAVIATVVFAGERLWFEAQAAVLRPAAFQGWDAMPEPPKVMIECDKPDCIAGGLFYEVLVDGTGRPSAIRFGEGFMPDATGRLRHIRFNPPIPFLEPPIRARATQAALAARWPAPESGRPFRAFQYVSIIPPERLPTRHVPFPETEGQAVSITLERNGPYSSLGDYVVTLDSDGDVDFCGPGYIKSPGPHRSHISRTAFESLVQEFREADFFSLDDRYAARATDGPVYYLRVRIGDQEKTVVDYYGREVGMPSVVTKLQAAVDAAAGTSKWVGSRQEWGFGDWGDCERPLSKRIG